jgi:hypothetical protein
MLLFSSGTFTTGGITVFPDHADPNQFWYLPGPVTLARMPDSDEPQFLLIMYAPDVTAGGIKGVGFLNLTLALRLSDDTQERIIGQIRTQFPDVSEPRLAPVPFDEGTVQVVALDLQGSGGTAAAAAPPGTFEAVEHILGAVTPELFGDNDALFALTLSEDGASILEQAFEDGMAPVGGIYNLKFTGVRPALDVKITADLKRVYDSFSVGLTAEVYWVSAGIDATFEKLRQDGVIKVEVVNLTTDAANSEKEQWALSLFKDQILAQWFQPTLSPTTATAASVPQPTIPTPSRTTGGITGGSTSTTTGGMLAPSGNKPAGALQPSSPTIKPPSSSSSSSPAITTPKPATPTSTPSKTPPATPPPTPAPPAQPPTVPAPNPVAAGTAAGASSAASPFGVALRLKYVSQDELKTVSIEYNRMDAVQRVYSPQGYFGLMLDKIDMSKHFLKVDGTDPFFSKFVVTVNPPKDFAGIGLLSAHVAIDYGDPSDPDRLKHGEFIFDPTHQTPQVWEVYEGLIQQTQFRYTVDYKFDPESGWQGEQTAYTLPTETTENRVLNLDPYDFLGFPQISVSVGKIDSTLVDRIEVALQYTAKSGWQTAATIIVRPDSKQQVWKLRLADKTDRSYTYSTTCYLKDGTSFSGGPTTSTASAIITSDPFVDALDLIVQPAFDSARTKLAIVEIAYRDDASNYSFQTNFEMPGSATTSTKVQIPLLNRTQNQYQYRITLIDNADQKIQGGYVTAQDPLVLVNAND